MKKLINTGANDKREIETEGNLWGFRANDIFIDELEGSVWRNRKVKIEGFENNKLWAAVLNENISQYADSPDGLILLERPGLKFKVGDRVKALEQNPKDSNGKVIVIPPLYSRQLYLVEFENWNGGHDGYDRFDRYNKPWFPKKYKNEEAKNRWWCEENELELIVPLEQEETSAGQTTKEPTEELRVDETKTTLSQIEQEVVAAVEQCLAEGNFSGQPRIVFRALGKSIYEKLTGHSEETDISFKLDGYPKIQNYSPEISEKISDIIMKMIKGDFRTAEELKKVLEEQFGKEEK